MKTIAILNQKGGCGKTTVAYNLAGALAFGKKILLIDLDSQGNLSKSLEYDSTHTAKDIFTGSSPVPCRTNVSNIDLIPADKTLSAITHEITADIDMQFRLREYLSTLIDYDLVIIDTPPTVGGFTLAAMIAANYFLIPISTNFYTTHGTSDLMETIAKVQKRLNPNLKMLGACISIHDKRTVLANEILTQTQKRFNGKTLNSIISKSIKVEEAAVNRSPVVYSFPKSQTAKEFKALANEIEEVIYG